MKASILPPLGQVAAKSLHYYPERPLGTKIVKLNIGNQLGLDFEGCGY